MGKKGGSRHLKRLPAPKFWPIGTKEFLWTAKPRPGPHPVDMCVPLGIVAREYLHLARTAREAGLMLSQGKVKVDGRIRKDEKYPVGLMDVLEIPDLKATYRVVPVERRGLALTEVSGEEAGFKLCRIDDKRTLAGGHVQISLHDGRSLLIKVQNPSNPTEDLYSTGASLQIEVPSQRIMKHMKMAEGAYAIVTRGRNLGRHGKISRIEARSALGPPIVEIKDSRGEAFRTVADYIFVVGEESSAIKLPGEMTG